MDSGNQIGVFWISIVQSKRNSIIRPLIDQNFGLSKLYFVIRKISGCFIGWDRVIVIGGDKAQEYSNFLNVYAGLNDKMVRMYVCTLIFTAW